MAEYVLGIDLGTSNSVVAAVREGRPEVLRDSEGRAIQPSVVSFHPTGSMLVGHEAKRRRLVDPDNTIFSAKRLIGRPFPDSEVQDFIGRVPYKVREGDNQRVIIEAREQELTVPEISAFVLHHMKIISERTLRQSVSKAVITVPANFNDAQRSATMTAGENAGLDVLRIINEPTAAALTYGFGQAMNKRVLVFDYGGGTFDVTILEINGEVYEVRATAGDTYLGGNDLDECIVQHMVTLFLEKHRYDLTQNEASMERLRSVAEQVKVQLSAQAKAVVQVQEIAYGKDGKPLDLNFDLRRDDFEDMVEEQVDRTFEICDEAFKLAQMRANAVDEVILVGGSTRIPMVRESVRSYFARTPLASVNPDEVVSLGAAIQGASLIGVPVLPPMAQKPGVPKTTAMGMAAAPPIPGVGATTPPPVPPGPDAASSSSALVPPPPPAPSSTASPAAPPPTPTPPPVPVPPVASPEAPGGGGQALGKIEVKKQEAPAASPALVPEAPDAAPASSALVPPPPSAPPALVPEAPDAAPASSALVPPPPSAPSPSESPMAPPPAPAPLQPAAPAADLSALQPKAAPAPEPEPPEIDLQPSYTGSHPIDLAGGSGDGLELDLVPPVAAPAPGAASSSSASAPPPAFAPSPAESPAAPPSAPTPSAPAAPATPVAVPARPLLLDVTPLSLGIATVGGYAKVIIPRNSPVPVEQSQTFSTGRDMQTEVTIRICQGESRKFEENQVLGELELSGLEAAPRGDTKVEVAFEIDTNGMLKVQASDENTGHAQQANIKLRGEASGGGKRTELQSTGADGEYTLPASPDGGDA